MCIPFTEDDHHHPSWVPGEAWQLFHLRHASITRIDVFSTGDRKVMRCRGDQRIWNILYASICTWMWNMYNYIWLYNYVYTHIYIYISLSLSLCLSVCVCVCVLHCLTLGVTWYTTCLSISDSGCYVRFLCYAAVPCYATRWCNIILHDRIGGRPTGMYFGICACLSTLMGLELVPSI